VLPFSFTKGFSSAYKMFPVKSTPSAPNADVLIKSLREIAINQSEFI